MKKAILSVSYGTCDKAQLEDTIARVEDLYGREFPDFEVFRAFTSKHVIASLKKAGVHVDTVSEALERLKKAGFDRGIHTADAYNMRRGIRRDSRAYAFAERQLCKAARRKTSS